MLNANTYITKEEGIGGTIRNNYEDFYVEEIPEIIPEGEGPNIWIWIEKTGRTTLDVMLDIAKELHIDRKRLGFAGMKDKKAVTRQWICVSNMESEEKLKEIENLNGEIYKTDFLKIVRGRKKLRMGQLKGNKFKIHIKDIKGLNESENPEETINEAVERADKILKTLEKTGVPNYFGWQRFGKPRTVTHLVGKSLVENDLKGAVDAYIGNPYPDEGPESKEARKAYDNGNLEEALDKMPNGLRYEKMMLRSLLKDLNKKGELDEKSYKNAINSLPKPLKRMFVNAYQSFLFNEIVSKRVELGINKYIPGDIIIDNEEHIVYDKTPEEFQELISTFKANPTSPLFGTKVPFAGGKVGEMEKNILKEHNLTLEDFKCPKTPKLGSHGIRRSMRFQVWDTKVSGAEDGVIIEFSINKGSYATAVLREVMKVDVV